MSDQAVERRRYLRFPLSYRIEHWVAMSSFTILAITGLVQLFPNVGISLFLIDLMGGIRIVRVIHRLAAIALMLEVVYHIGAVGYRMYVLRVRPKMLPNLDDFQNAWLAIRYNLGRADEHPQQDRYTFEEKAEYWAFVWGTVIMVITGFMMWNPIATTRFLPGQAIPAAKAAHGGEAVLAVLAIIVWHMYHVHVRSFNRSMFTGYMSEDEMLEEHPLELADIKAGLAQTTPDEGAVRRRRRMFLSVYGVLAAVLLVGIYFFATFEETAIATVPQARDGVPVFVPFTPTPVPTARPSETASGETLSSWEDGVADLFERKCGVCHNLATSSGGLDLSTYQAALQGGQSGPGIVPGDPDESQVILVQIAGGHPGQLTGREIESLRAWILNGAPEQ